jgi:sulfur carrier protein ThiS
VEKNLYITIELFGMHGIIAAADRIQMPVTGKTTVQDAINFVISKYPGIVIHKESIVVAVNHDIVPLTKALEANDIVSLLPHIGGG